ncbi:hypothetical protein I601_2720 [Nocardioides dokdonensis FR1436]|uniref:DUF3040 domain-containing protein n=1 Tax=Nocardioides dokdonensis FR1436 TaxID=1300347 RepID=A0A1A9GM29_9ACTN|nr:DUF3040 domain-containing protein [Nocardioides dokdonensis]ANH39136.1 hypothetical protein I601_2720 [Nocardioides dokdonensis FR1436]
MPLSEEELRLLEQMERALSEEDPKFASTLRGTSLRRVARRRAVAAGAVFALGIVLLMTGAVSQIWAIGIVGFIVMLGSATFGLNALRSQTQAGPAGEAGHAHDDQGSRSFTVIDGGRRSRSRSRRNQSSGSFMERMDERWRRRREENGGF